MPTKVGTQNKLLLRTVFSNFNTDLVVIIVPVKLCKNGLKYRQNAAMPSTANCGKSVEIGGILRKTFAGL
jgi:hypothetical protein